MHLGQFSLALVDAYHGHSLRWGDVVPQGKLQMRRGRSVELIG